MSRSRQAIRNYLSGILTVLVTLGVSLVATPLLLRWLGDERLGAYRATGEWLGYVMLLDLGMGGAVSSLLAQAVGRQDRAATEAVLAAGTQVYIGVALVMAAGVAVLALSITALVPVASNLAGDLEWGCWASLLGFLLVPLIPWQRLADASQRGDVTNSLLIVHNLVMTGVALLLAWHGWGITGQFLAEVAGKLPIFVVLTWVGLQHYPGALPRLTNWSALAPVRRDLWHVNWMVLLLSLCSRVSLLTDNILIARMLGPMLVVPFYLTQRLPQLAQSQLNGVGNASWAALVELWVNEQVDTFNRRLLELTKLIAILGVAGMVPIAVFNRHFIDLWVGEDRFGGEWLTALAALNGFFLAIYSLWLWVFVGTGQTARIVPLSVLGATINITASIVCVHYFGLVGPLLGTFIVLTAVNLWCLPLLLRAAFGTPVTELFKVVAWPLVVGLPYIAAVSWLAQTQQAWGWISMGAAMAAAGLVFLALAWLVILNRAERAFWLERFFGSRPLAKHKAVAR